MECDRMVWFFGVIYDGMGGFMGWCTVVWEGACGWYQTDWEWCMMGWEGACGLYNLDGMGGYLGMVYDGTGRCLCVIIDGMGGYLGRVQGGMGGYLGRVQGGMGGYLGTVRSLCGVVMVHEQRALYVPFVLARHSNTTSSEVSLHACSLLQLLSLCDPL